MSAPSEPQDSAQASASASKTTTAAVERPYEPSPPPGKDVQVGFIGLGNMGFMMALNLAKGLANFEGGALPPLLVWNRTASKATQFAQEAGGEKVVQIASSVEEVGKRCQVVFTSMANDEAALEVFAKLCKGEEEARGDNKEQRSHSVPHVVFCDTSTIYPDTTGQLECLVSAMPRRHFVAAPTFGRPPAARAAKLLFGVGGPYASKQLISHFLTPHMGAKILDFGSNPEKATTFKLVGNSMVLGIVELLSETMTLADKTGVGADRFVEFMKVLFPAPAALVYADKILHNDFSVVDGFSLTGGIKDATHIRRLATSVDCPMGIIDQAHRHMITARANAGSDGGDQKDWSCLVGGQRISSGLDPWQGKLPGLYKD